MPDQTPILDDIRVLDLTRILAGPYCTMILGDLGADVIKIEVPGSGDDTRRWGPPFAKGGESAYFLCVNRNKRSVTINLKNQNGLQVLTEMIKRSDILVENFKVGTLESLGLSYQELLRLRPDMIYCTITGYGYTGPYKDKPGYDFTIQAQGGVMSITGPTDGGPYKVGVAIADITAGLFACNAILAALFARERTGVGQRIDISLLDSQVAWLANVASNYLISGQIPQRYGNAHPNIVPYQTFRARDGVFVLAVGNDAQWQTLCSHLGQPGWACDERFSTNAQRVGHRHELVELLESVFIEKPLIHWLALLENARIPCAPVNSIDQVLDDPQVLARLMLVEMPHPTAGPIRMVASPLNIPTAPVVYRLPPPMLGEHTEQVLSQVLGYKRGKIIRLRRDGAI